MTRAHLFRNGHPHQYHFDGGYISFSADTVDGFYYYIQDYMGNNRMVVNGRTDSIEQITHYYPYGGVIGDISTNESMQPYKFEGKVLAAIEKIDNLRREDEPSGEGKDRTFGLDNYDVEARQYFAMAPMWDRVDPLAEKYYGISPYAYCGGDPVNNVDPDGMDVWDINDEGRIITRQKDTSMDIFYLCKKNDVGEYERVRSYDENGNMSYISISFDYGTIESQRSLSYSPRGEGIDLYDVYQIRGDEQGQAFFEFMAEIVANNRIEIGHFKCGVEGERGLNYVTNSHLKPLYYTTEDGSHRIKSSEPAQSMLLHGQLLYGYTIREINHSHPNSLIPSAADLRFHSEIQTIYGSNAPQMNIWNVNTRQYLPF